MSIGYVEIIVAVVAAVLFLRPNEIKRAAIFIGRGYRKLVRLRDEAASMFKDEEG